MAERWPRMMKRKTASAYCDLSESAFEREVMDGRLPCAIMLGNREHWLRDALDAAIDQLAGGQAEPDYRQKLREQYGTAA